MQYRKPNKASDLNVPTRSLGDNPSDPSFVLGNNITGIPLFLAYSAPPHSIISKLRNNKKILGAKSPRLKIKENQKTDPM